MSRPKLVVGIVIDEMSWDYLYRFYPLFKNDGGFKRFLNGGFSCEIHLSLILLLLQRLVIPVLIQALYQPYMV